jgi:post-segregation antitoxin (ccd killing protein)
MGKVELNIGVDPELIEQAKRWADDNAEAIRAYNDRIARDGCFGEEFRTW